MDDYKEQKWGHGSYKREDQQSPGNREEQQLVNHSDCSSQHELLDLPLQVMGPKNLRHGEATYCV